MVRAIHFLSSIDGPNERVVPLLSPRPILFRIKLFVDWILSFPARLCFHEPLEDCRNIPDSFLDKGGICRAD